MVIKPVNLERVCGITSRLPDNSLPEIALAGRSNVGKSSLINTLINRKSYARTSSEPGKTQTINYYNINNDLYFVDLPGYGYAKVSQSVRDKWGKMIEKYLHTSKALVRVLLLADIRRIPSDKDIQMYDWITASGFMPVVIATKADKLKKSQIAPALKAIRDTLHMEKDIPLVTFSAVTKQGREEIWDIIEKSISPEDL